MDDLAQKSGDETDSSHILIKETGAALVNQDNNERLPSKAIEQKPSPRK